MGANRLGRNMLYGVLIVAGLCAIGLGGLTFATTHTAHPIELDGTIADYKEVTINGAYAYNELRLTGDDHTYTVDRGQLHPDLPDRLIKDGEARIWVDQGTTTVLAIALYDQLGLNPRTYSSSAYDNPTIAALSQQVLGGATAVVGLVMLLIAIARLRGRKMPQKVHGKVSNAPPPASIPPAWMPARMEVYSSQERVPALVGARQENTAMAPPTRSAEFDRSPMLPPRTSGRDAAGRPGEIDQIVTARTPAVMPATSPAAERFPMPPAGAPDRSVAGGSSDLDQVDTVRTPAIAPGAREAVPWPEPSNSFGAQPEVNNPFRTPAEPNNPSGTLPETNNPFGFVPEPSNPFGAQMETSNPFGTPIELSNPFDTWLKPDLEGQGPAGEYAAPLADPIDQQPTAKTPAVHAAASSPAEREPEQQPEPAPGQASADDPATFGWASAWGLPAPDSVSGGAEHSHRRLTPLSLSGSGLHGEQPQQPWGVAWGAPPSPKPVDEQPTERTPAVSPERDAPGQPPDRARGDA